MDEALLVAENLGKKFFRKSRESAAYVDVVAGVDLALQRGQLVALRGRSGGIRSGDGGICARAGPMELLYFCKYWCICIRC